jgi:anionic cell wall polymer biosynthesis LytR-Cps2A-Psr (LCP) family protein
VLTVHTPISVAGHEVNGREVGVKYRLQPGTRRFMGYEAMWFARSRSNSNDFERMGRQRCVIAAVTSQTNPVTLARAFPDIAAAIKDDLRMSIPIEDLSAWVTLLLRVKSGHIRSLPFTQSNVSTSHPDFEKIHRMVQDAIAGQSTTVPKKKPTTKPSGSTPTAGTPAPADTTKAVDVKDVC